MPDVEILEVVPAQLNPQVFWGSSIDLPAAGERRKHYALVVAGWVASRDLDSLNIEAVSDGRTLARWRANVERRDVAAAFPDLPVNSACGFIGVVSTLELRPTFELQVEIVTKYGRLPLGVIRGRRSTLLTAADEPLLPAPVITLGRTGSTLLMLLLGQHPQLLVHPPFPFETRVLSYWTSIFAGLSSPTSYLQALAAVDTRRYWWVGYDSFATETYLDQDIAAQRLGGAALEATAGFAHRQVQGFYEASAALQGKPVAGRAYFVEKQLPDPGLLAMQTELFPIAREIYLVRDFRDMLTSIVAFNLKRRFASFGRTVLPDDDEYIFEQGQAVEKLVTAFDRAGDRGLLVRYEDLVAKQHATLERILRFLEVDSSRAAIGEMINHAAGAEPEAQAAHRTSADALRSIGRWRDELPAAWRERCQVVFADALAACGYER